MFQHQTHPDNVWIGDALNGLVQKEGAFVVSNAADCSTDHTDHTDCTGGRVEPTDCTTDANGVTTFRGISDAEANKHKVAAHLKHPVSAEVGAALLFVRERLRHSVHGVDQPLFCVRSFEGVRQSVEATDMNAVLEQFLFGPDALLGASEVPAGKLSETFSKLPGMLFSRSSSSPTQRRCIV